MLKLSIWLFFILTISRLSDGLCKRQKHHTQHTNFRGGAMAATTAMTWVAAGGLGSGFAGSIAMK